MGDIFDSDARESGTAAEAAKAAQQSATANRRSVFSAAETNARALANRLKAHAAYNETLGQSLGIVGPEDSTDLTQEKPTLTADSVNPGHVTIGFNKSISDGVMIHSKRGAQTAFAMLAWDTRSPYVDNRANLAPGPEDREYRAQYFVNDEPIGQFSDVLQVTVPG